MPFRFLPALLLLTLCFPPSLSGFQSGGESSRNSWIIRPHFAEPPRRIPPLYPHAELKKPKVGLVLSGGGARGISSLGVLKAFENHDIPVDLIVGTSMGAIVGGLYAAGYSVSQLIDLVDSTDWNDLLTFGDDARRRDMFLDQKLSEDRSLLVLRFDGFEPVIPEALSTGQRLTNYLSIRALQGIYHPSPGFDDLRVSFRAVTTDLVSGERVVIGSGDLAEAMRASATVPLLFSTVKKDTLQLLDGGLVSNIPVDVAWNEGADLVIAVDATSPLRPPDKLSAPWEIADQIIGIMMKQARDVQLALADIVVRPSIGNHLSSDFGGLDSLIALGEEAGNAAIAELRTLYQEKLNDLLFSEPVPQFLRDPLVRFDGSSLGWEWTVRLDSLLMRGSIGVREARAFVTAMYESGDFATAEFEVMEEDTRTILTLRAVRNPLLTDVTFVGHSILSTDSLRRVMEPLLGQSMNVNRNRRAMEELLSLYRTRGYSLARVRSTSYDSATGVVTVFLDEGIVTRRTVVGTERTKDYVIWRELPWNQGDVFQASRVAQGLSNLYTTNLFEQVS
ncbi:MAG: patatin-like phospholipase family protein, partial [Bacteroidota bacterium]